MGKGLSGRQSITVLGPDHIPPSSGFYMNRLVTAYMEMGLIRISVDYVRASNEREGSIVERS